jgi:hypothetical protein
MPAGGDNTSDRGAYMPTEDEIREACRMIRAGWKDGIDHSRERPNKLGRAAEVVYSASAELEDDE